MSIEPRFAPAEEGPEEWLSTELGARCELERERPPPYCDVSGDDASVELACDVGRCSLLICAWRGGEVRSRMPDVTTLLGRTAFEGRPF